MDTEKASLAQVGEDNAMNDGVQTPDISKDGKIRRKAIRDSDQAHSIYQNLENDNRTRTTINAEIVARHTGKPPHDPKELEAHAQNWRSNFPTLSLMGIESRITARLVNTIDNLRVLTNSRLPESVDDHDEKSNKFQQRLTSYVRRWTGWRSFISQLWSEVVLIGYGCVGLLDDYNWRPRLFRSDEAFLPQGCPQYSKFVQIAGVKQSFMIHEVVDWIEDKEVAEVAKFQVDNVIASVNRARPKNPLEDQQSAGNASRVYQDLVREGNVGMAYSTGAKGVNVGHVLAVESEKDEDGNNRVTHYMIDRDNDHKPLLINENRFKSMEDALCLFTLEPGNSTYYGSKGLGRKCVNITTAMDVAANDAVDAYRMSSLGVLITDSKGGIATQIKMTNPFVIVTTDAELQQQRFNFNAEGFKALYAQLGMILENSVGEYLPNLPADPIDPTKGKRTATGERIDYQREQEQSIAFIARGLGQFFDMVQPMQRRLCDPETTDEDAKACQKDLMEIDKLTREEIDMLAEANTAEVVQDLANQRNQQFDAMAAKYMNHPMVNQLKLVRGDISAMTSPQVADDVILPESIDPNSQAEQMQKQITENTVIQSGNAINVAPRDDDKEHLNVLIGELEQAAPKLMQKKVDDESLPQLMDNFSAGLVHGEAHISNWTRKTGGKPTPEIEKYAAKIKEFDSGLQKMGKMLQGMQQKRAMAQQKQARQSQQPLVLPPGAQPPSQNGQVQQPPQEGMAPEITRAWIGQFPNLSQEAQRRLELKSGLGADPQPQPASVQPGQGQIATGVQTG